MPDLLFIAKWAFRLVLVAILVTAILDFDQHDLEPTYEYKKILLEGGKCR